MAAWARSQTPIPNDFKGGEPFPSSSSGIGSTLLSVSACVHMPPRLSSEEADIIAALATPIAYGRRAAFFETVVQALVAAGESGPGNVYGAPRAAQMAFTTDLRAEAAMEGRPRWSQQRK
jgi:hypothetical protein